jgi:NAD(P)-dependent dehydrogenase (short-subunit alcohol dehydrogenase family)
MNLNGKIVIVTGGAGLLGSEYCKAINEINGIPVALDINEESLCKLPSYVKTYLCDITNEEKILETFERIKANLGGYHGAKIYGLINNSAIDPKFEKNSTNTPRSRLENYPLEQWNKEIAVGLTGAFLCTKIFAPELARNRQGSIINVSSVLGLVAPNQSLYELPGVENDMQNVKPVTYSCIKHAIIGLTKYTSTYYAKNNVRCNAIAPGGVFNNHSQAFVEKLSKYIPLARMSKIGEYNELIKFLLTDASSFMTGAVIPIDGGQSTW